MNYDLHSNKLKVVDKTPIGIFFLNFENSKYPFESSQFQL